MQKSLSHPETSLRPLFIASEVYRATNHVQGHPLAIPRVTLTMDLCRALGWLDDSNFVESPRATPADLGCFHDPAYINAVATAEREGDAPEEVRRRHHIGANGNTIFDGMYRRPATACGGGMLAARLLMAGEADVIYAPGGGQHHARHDQASGFCYFNEPVLSILTMLEHGAERVLYLDFDAHFGDGVQDAFADRAGDDTLHPRGWALADGARWPGLRRRD